MTSLSQKVFDHTVFAINVHKWFFIYLALGHALDWIILGQ